MSIVTKKRTLNKAFAAKAQSATRALLDRCAVANANWLETSLVANPPAL